MTDTAVPPTNRTGWILECGCESMIEHCSQCDERRQTVRLVQLEEAVERACRAIYREFEGYWPNNVERAHIAVALLARAEDSNVKGER